MQTWGFGLVLLGLLLIGVCLFVGLDDARQDATVSEASRRTLAGPVDAVEMVKVGAHWVHPDCLAAYREGFAGLDCCRYALWGEDLDGESKPFWPQLGFAADAAALHGDVDRIGGDFRHAVRSLRDGPDLTAEEREEIMRKIDRVWREEQ